VKPINEIAQEYGVHPVLVGQWKNEVLAQARAQRARLSHPVKEIACPVGFGHQARLWQQAGLLRSRWCRACDGIHL
jgi:transposase-like protein